VIFTATPIACAYIVDIDRKYDERGFFARLWCQQEFEEHGLNPRMVQCNVSLNVHKGTLRGMHYQLEPHAEAKLVRCTRGSLYDVVVDLRPESASFRQAFGLVLSSDNQRALYIPERCAHGFLTLEDNTEVFYQMSEFYAPDAARGFRWNDPGFTIVWPDHVRIISERDRSYADFEFHS
jgi:dTDP-4-dehydrorhamnose 3,5-epimerase